jgi:diguanylate cyclase (GGDEF)-like protein
MKINRNSIIFKTFFILISSSIVFISFISLSSKHIFSKAYLNVEKEKIETISDNISPQIALNLSYGFYKAIDEITHNSLNEDPGILLIKIESDYLIEPLFFSQNKKNNEIKSHSQQFTKKTILKDPTTNEKIGYITIYYSEKSYNKYMNDFYSWFLSGISLFILLMMILAYYLYTSFKRLSHLDNALKHFDPSKPQTIYIEEKSSDEISSISYSAKNMIDDIIKFLNNEKELNTKLLQNKKHLEDAQRLAKIGSWEYDLEKNELKLSDEIYRILGIKLRTKLTYKDVFSYIDRLELPYVKQVFFNAIKNGSTFNLMYTMNIKKRSVVLHTVGKVRKKINGEAKITAVSMDVTESEEDKKTIERLAYYDSLTNLPNRTLLKDRIYKAIQSAKREKTKVAVIFLDLDHFKLINDTLGHSVGDDILIHVSKILTGIIRESDTVSRLGGDEFVILLNDINSISDIEKICNKILKSLDGQHLVGAHQLYITTSVGASIYPDNSMGMNDLITNADTAMYDAKQAGRNCYKIYSKDMGNYISRQMIIEQDLKDSLNAGGVGLIVYYQPKIDSQTNFITGAEALIRWNHPIKGMIYPDEFISVAESTGIIIELGKWIIEDCIKQIKSFNELGLLKLKIAINLSPRQFQDQTLIPFVSKKLHDYNVGPDQIEFEITESLSMKNLDNTLKILNDFKNIGISIAIDDFGTGHSSLSYLKKFPINTLKIDQSFVFDILEDEGNKIIVQTIISMAHSLGFVTVAEGVETKEHVRMLKNMDCDQLQGYYYSKPIPAAIFIDYIQNYDPNI